MEIDGATHTGVDAWREIKSTLRLLPLQGDTKVVIVDECQMLTRNTWNALLKDTEEPPDHVYWILCTTELTKVPITIRNRCTSFTLTTVDCDSLLQLVDEVAEEEGIKLPENVGWEIVEYAEGSPRKALTGLEAACAVESVEEAREVLAQVDKEGEVIEICRGLAGGQLSWKRATDILRAMPKPHNSEGMRRVTLSYFTGIALKSNEKSAGQWLAILEAFGQPYVETTSLAPFVLSLGKVLLDE
jgi:DNA polymerase-3 subunit gamma/tau